MEGPPRGSPLSLRLTRDVESSRLQLDLVRRAFELLVPNRQHPVAKRQDARSPHRSAAAARRAALAGE
jgi:hypothetical protein